MKKTKTDTEQNLPAKLPANAETLLATFDTMRREIESYKDLFDLKEKLNQAETIRVYLRQCNASLELQNQCARLKLIGERLVGMELAEMERSSGGRTGKNSSQAGKSFQAQLKEYKIPTSSAYRYIELSRCAKDFFERTIENVIEKKTQELSTALMLREIRREKKSETVVDVSTQEKDSETSPLWETITLPVKDYDIHVADGDIWQLGDHVLYCGHPRSDAFNALLKDRSDIAFSLVNAAVWGTEQYEPEDFEALLKAGRTLFVINTNENIGALLSHQMMSRSYRHTIPFILFENSAKVTTLFSWLPVVAFSQDGDAWRGDGKPIMLSHKMSEDESSVAVSYFAIESFLIESASEPNDTIVAPFLRNGTTLMTVHNKGRKCVGAGEDPKNCSSIIGLWEERTGQKAVKISEGGKK